MTGKNNGNNDDVSRQANTPVPGSRETVQAEDEQPTSKQGDVRRTDSGRGQQGTQQQMNSEAQQQAAVSTRPAMFTAAGAPLKDAQGNEVPFFPAPRGHAADNLTRLNQRAREQERTQAKVDLPASATHEALQGAKFAPMPAGGLHALASQLFPDDVNDQEAMDNHIFDLLTLNRDTLRDESAFTAGQNVRIPG